MMRGWHTELRSLLRTRKATHTRGYTVIELMVGVVVVGIVLAATVPNLRSYRESQRMASACDRVAAMCRIAKSRARAQNHQIIMTYDITNDEVSLLEDENDNNVADAGESIETFELPSGVFFGSSTFTNNALVFNNRGRCVNGGSVIVDGYDHVDSKRIRISAGTGQVKILPVSP